MTQWVSPISIVNACHGFGLVDITKWYSYLNQCSHRREYRIWGRRRNGNLSRRRLISIDICAMRLKPLFAQIACMDVAAVCLYRLFVWRWAVTVFKTQVDVMHHGMYTIITALCRFSPAVEVYDNKTVGDGRKKIRRPKKEYLWFPRAGIEPATFRLQSPLQPNVISN